MSRSDKLQSVEFHTFYDVPVHCPYCGVNPEGTLRDGGEATPCAHTLFMGHSEGWMHLSERAEGQLKENGYEINRSEDFIEIMRKDEDGEDEFVTLQDIKEALSFPDGVLFEQYVGPPSLFSSFTAFAGLEDDEG